MTKHDTLVLVAVFLTAYVFGRCSEQGRAETAALREAGRVTDSMALVTDRRVAELARREIARESTLSVIAAENDVLRQRVRRIRASFSATPVAGYDTAATEQLALRDSVIAAQDTIITRQDSALTILRAGYAERGVLLTEALSERDAYRNQRDQWMHKASKRIACGVGPGVTVSLSGRALGGLSAACVVRL